MAVLAQQIEACLAGHDDALPEEGFARRRVLIGAEDGKLRAQQLASVRVRWALATGFRAVAAEAKRPPSPPPFAPLVLLPLAATHPHAAVPIGTTDALLDIADALTEPGCTSVRAVARASWLLCDVTRSPLYERLPPLTLQRLAGDIAAALHGAP